MTAPAPILVPVDFEPASMAAFHKAIELAHSMDTTVVALHTFALPPYVYRGIGPNLLERIRQQTRQAAVRPLEALAVPDLVQPLLREGDAAQQILAVAAEMRPEMVVMGSHARRGADRVMLGSVAESVLRKAAVPVMVVHADQPQESTSVVLCATELDDESRPAIDLAMRHAQCIGGRVQLVHAYAAPIYLYPHVDPGLALQLEREMKHSATRRIMALETELGPLRAHIVEGQAGKVIVDAAARLRPAAIVMATHGRSGVARAFLGSVTEWVMRRSPFPVLTTHPAPAPKAAPRHEPARKSA